MPRQKFRSKQKHGGRGGGGGGHGKPSGNRPKRPDIDKVGRKYRFMQQNQENEESLRQQQELEKRYRERNADPHQVDGSDAESSSGGENEAGGLDELISTFKGDQRAADAAIESEDDEDGEDDDDGEGGEEEDGDEEDDGSDEELLDADSGDDVFPEKFEEQSQPRGRKYRSSDEENSESDENDADSDDLPEDTAQILLRPEEFDTDKQQFEGRLTLYLWHINMIC